MTGFSSARGHHSNCNKSVPGEKATFGGASSAHNCRTAASGNPVAASVATARRPARGTGRRASIRPASVRHRTGGEAGPLSSITAFSSGTSFAISCVGRGVGPCRTSFDLVSLQGFDVPCPPVPPGLSVRDHRDRSADPPPAPGGDGTRSYREELAAVHPGFFTRIPVTIPEAAAYAECRPWCARVRPARILGSPRGPRPWTDAPS